MDIKPHQPHIATTAKIDSLELKVNQQLSAKILNAEANIQTLALQLAKSNKPIQVQSNQATHTKPGQTLQLVVTQITPTAEFKVINSDQEKNRLITTPLILKQIPRPSDLPVNAINKLLLNPPQPSLLTAKIISLSGDKIQFYFNPKNQFSEHKSPFISLNKNQLKLFQPLSNNSPKSNTHDFFKGFKVGQHLQLSIQKTAQQLDYKVVLPITAKLFNQQAFSAKILEMGGNKIQLSVNTEQNINNIPSSLSINKNQLLASTTELKQGQSINLEVLKSQSQTTFKLLTNQQFQDLKIQQLFKQVLPIQESPFALLNTLQTNQTSLQEHTSISKKLRHLAREIISNLPQAKNITQPQQLKQSINQSGLFLETNLLQFAGKQGILLQQDFKTQLLKFNRALNDEIKKKQHQETTSNELKLLKELQQKTESTLAKIVLNQLNSLPKEETGKQMWLIDLPFINHELIESAHLEINREKPSNEDQEEQEKWSVTITISPPEIGTIHCKVSCFDNTINTLFWSDQQETVSTINLHIDTLKQQFEKAGINPGQLSAYKGTIKSPTTPQLIEKSLIDQRV